MKKYKSSEGLVSACSTLINRINTARNTNEYLNIKYENFIKITEKISTGGSTWEHEYRRLYKKAHRAGISTRDLFNADEV